MNYRDLQNLPLTGADTASLEHYTRALHQFRCYVEDPVASVDSAIAQAPGFAMAHIFKAYLHLLGTEPEAMPVARECLAAARRYAGNDRERAHIAAINALTEGRWHDAGRALEDATIENPRDILALQAGHLVDFFTGNARMMAFAPAENLVAIAAAPPTIDGALKAAYESAAIYYPFTDVIVADPYAAIEPGLKLAFYIGQSKVVGGVVTDMVAIASDNLFVQIWIGAEDKLPRMMRAVFRDDPLRLRHQLEMSNWQLDPTVAADDFASAKAAAATRIAFAAPKVPTTPPGVKPAAVKPAAKPASKPQ